MGWNFISEPPSAQSASAAIPRSGAEYRRDDSDEPAGTAAVSAKIPNEEGLPGSVASAADGSGAEGPPSTGTAIDYLYRMKAAHAAAHNGDPMPPATVRATMRKLLALQSLYFEDAEAVSAYGDRGYWEALAGGELHVTDTPRRVSGGTTSTVAAGELGAEGYTIIRGGAAPSGDPAIFARLNRAAGALAAAGWPPAFLLVYDEVWQVLHCAAESFASLLGDECWLEPDLNVWALRPDPPAPADATTAHPEIYIGKNFGSSHRDMRYDQCHDPDTGDFRSCNAWVPINPSGATRQNGCMSVVPITKDDFFFSPAHPNHMATAAAGLSYEPVHLVAAAGDICTWLPSCVHWGNPCQAGLAEEPRISIAATFRSNDAPRSAYGDIAPRTAAGISGDNDGPQPVQRRNLDQIGLSQRLSYAAKALLAFSHWYPGFPGLTADRLERGSR
jgi:hypothetical protein